MTHDTQAGPTPRDRITAWAARHGVTMTAEFVPYSKSRNAKPGPFRKEPWLSLNWIVRLHKGGKVFLTVDYNSGGGTTPAAKRNAAFLAPSGRPTEVARKILTAWECERGCAGRFANWRDEPVPYGAKGAYLMPDLADVLYSLQSDGQAIDAGTFENWASDYGYDTDSRSAEKTFRACVEIGLAMRSALGETGLSDLATACEDY